MFELQLISLFFSTFPVSYFKISFQICSKCIGTVSAKVLPIKLVERKISKSITEIATAGRIEALRSLYSNIQYCLDSRLSSYNCSWSSCASVSQQRPEGIAETFQGHQIFANVRYFLWYFARLLLNQSNCTWFWL